MTQKEFTTYLQKSCHLDRQQSTLLLSALGKQMAQAGIEQIPVTLPGLGTFVAHKHPEYIEDDPATGRQTLYPPRITYRMQGEGEADAGRQWLDSQLAETTRTPLDEASRFVATVASSILAVLARGEEVEVKGIGTFRTINSNQGEIQRVAYTPDEQMKELVNAPFNFFEPVTISQKI